MLKSLYIIYIYNIKEKAKEEKKKKKKWSILNKKSEINKNGKKMKIIKKRGVTNGWFGSGIFWIRVKNEK